MPTHPTTNQHATLTHYLSRYGEAEHQLIPATTRHFDFTLLIPCYNEPPSLAAKLQRMFQQQTNLLVIIVVNAPPEKAALANSLAMNRRLTQALEALAPPPPQSSSPPLITASHVKWIHCAGGNSVLLVSRYQQGLEIPAKQGVGLARKIAADIACQLIAQDVARSNWIYSTDADADLPPEYFQSSIAEIQSHPNPQQLCAALLPFRHGQPLKEAHHTPQEPTANPPSSLLAMQLYEFSLHYYVAALNWSQSPFAFYSIGSTLILNCHYYAKVRGFPKKSAGEDFYLLNKLAKLGGILSLPAPLINLEARPSSRTPFGTGRAIQTIASLGSAKADYLYYAPCTFLYLKHWLAAIAQLWPHRHLTPDQALATALYAQTSPTTLFDPEVLAAALAQQNIHVPLAHGFKQCSSRLHFIRHMHSYFDGFRTLKLIHWLRDNHFPSLNQRELTQSLQSETFQSIHHQLRHHFGTAKQSLIPPLGGLHDHFLSAS